MNVRTVCLSLLYEDEATGYEIRKTLGRGRTSLFIDASFGSIYPALAKLEAEGLVEGRIEQQDGKPAKKVYAITEDGRTAFINSLFDKLGVDEYRSEFLLFARFASELPASLVEARLRERLDQIDQAMKEMDVLALEHTKPGEEWVLGYGRCWLTVAHDYIATHMHKLIALAKPEPGQARAAE